MISEEEVLAILIKSLPGTGYKDLERITRSIMVEAEDWQKADLIERIHDEIELKILHEARRVKSGYGLAGNPYPEINENHAQPFNKSGK